MTTTKETEVTEIPIHAPSQNDIVNLASKLVRYHFHGHRFAGWLIKNAQRIAELED